MSPNTASNIAPTVAPTTTVPAAAPPATSTNTVPPSLPNDKVVGQTVRVPSLLQERAPEDPINQKQTMPSRPVVPQKKMKLSNTSSTEVDVNSTRADNEERELPREGKADVTYAGTAVPQGQKNGMFAGMGSHLGGVDTSPHLLSAYTSVTGAGGDGPRL